MKISRRPRHWIAILLALATTVVAGIAFADFSGKPAPPWRNKVAINVGLALTALAGVGNYVLDRRAPANQVHVARKK